MGLEDFGPALVATISGAINALAGEADELLQRLGSLSLRNRDLDGLHFDAHLVILGIGLGALVLLVRTTALAAAMIEDGDHRRSSRLVILGASRQALKEGSNGSSSSTGLNDLAATKIHRLPNIVVRN